MQKIPFMLIVGEKKRNGTISIRRHGQEGKETSALRLKFAEIVDEEIKKDIKNIYSLT
jgi:threonyl-tRNA synthetase